jgi:hypothetical protein
MLTIYNYHKIKHANISFNGQRWKVLDATERENWYEFAIAPQIEGVFVVNQSQFVKVFRLVEANGFEYLMMLNDNASRGLTKIHKQYLKDPKDLLNWIGSKYLMNISVC